MTNIILHKAGEADFDAVLGMIRELAVFERSEHILTNTAERMRQEKDCFECLLIQTPDGRTAGYVIYYFCYYTWTGKALYMDDLYVKPEFRRQGIGSQVLRHMIELARESGCHKIRWQVLQWNEPAIALYKKAGAQVGGDDRNCDIIF